MLKPIVLVAVLDDIVSAWDIILEKVELKLTDQNAMHAVFALQNVIPSLENDGEEEDSG